MDDDRERQILLELRSRPRENEVSKALGTSGQLVQQSSLADPGLTHDLDRSRPNASVELLEDLLEQIDFSGAPYQTVVLPPCSRCDAVRHRASLGQRANVSTIAAAPSSAKARIAVSSVYGGSIEIRV